MSDLSNYSYILNIIHDINALIDIGIGIDIDTNKNNSTYLYNNNIRLPRKSFENIKCSTFENLNNKLKNIKDNIITGKKISITARIETMEKTLKILILAILWYRKVNINEVLLNNIYNKLINLPSFLNEIYRNNNIISYYTKKIEIYKENFFSNEQYKYENFQKNIIKHIKTIKNSIDIKKNKPNSDEPIMNIKIKTEIKNFIKEYINRDNKYFFENNNIYNKFNSLEDNLSEDVLLEGLYFISKLFDGSYTPDKFINDIFSTKTILSDEDPQMIFLIHLINKIYLLMGRDISQKYTFQKGKIKGYALTFDKYAMPIPEDNLLGYLFYINGFLLGRWLNPSDYANGKFLINSLKECKNNITNENYLKESESIIINRNRSYNKGYITQFEINKELIKKKKK